VHGRPTQTIQATSDEEITFDMSREERQRLIRELAEENPALAERLGIRLPAS
jgi:hypothetical protein